MRRLHHISRMVSINMKNLFYLLLLFLVGCSSLPTPYQDHPVQGDGFYSTNLSEISDDSPYKPFYPEFDYRVSVYLNQHSKLERALDYSFKRAAEVAKDNKYDGFIFSIENSHYEQRKWKGGGVSGINYMPYVVLFVKFQNMDNKKVVDNYKNAQSVLDSFKNKYIDAVQGSHKK